MTILEQIDLKLNEFKAEWPDSKPAVILGRESYNFYADSIIRLKSLHSGLREDKTAWHTVYRDSRIIINEIYPYMIEVAGEIEES
jgi:hypothetical protein